jgi:hypothetical protein
MRADQRDGRQHPGRRPPPDAQRSGRESSVPSGGTVAALLGHLAGWMRGHLRAVGERLYEGPDRQAREYGWQITVRHGGLARCYRDPRFDLLAACGKCGGTGAGADDRPCPRCSGTGRVILGQMPGPAARSQP